MAPAGEFSKGLWSGKLEFFIANFKLKDVSTYHPRASYQPNHLVFSSEMSLNICIFLV